MTPDEFKQARRAIGLSGAALSRALEIDSRTLRRYERGHPIPFPIVLLVRLSLKYAFVRNELKTHAKRRP